MSNGSPQDVLTHQSCISEVPSSTPSHLTSQHYCTSATLATTNLMLDLMHHVQHKTPSLCWLDCSGIYWTLVLVHWIAI